VTFTAQYLKESVDVIAGLDHAPIERMATLLGELRERNGRLFILGMGGGAGHASHAVNDFRKIAGIETYSPCDNVSELTARANDEGLDTIYSAWLEVSRLAPTDMVMIFSVGGGDLERNISSALVRAIEYAKSVGAVITGVVGRDGGYTAKVADACCIVPVVNADNITPHTESFQALVWHLLVSHPDVKRATNKWESQK